MEKSVKMWEQGRFFRVGKMRCVATGRPVAQDHAEEPRGNLMNSVGLFSDAGCRLLALLGPQARSELRLQGVE